MDIGRLLFWLGCAAWTWRIGAKKGESLGAFLIGLYFGPGGVLIAWASSGYKGPRAEKWQARKAARAARKAAAKAAAQGARGAK